MAKKPDPRLKRAGVSGYNKPKRTPNHPTKSHVVVAKEGRQAALLWTGLVGQLRVKMAQYLLFHVYGEVVAAVLGGCFSFMEG